MNNSSIIDISWPISPAMTSYKNGNEVKFIDGATFEKNHHRKSLITLSAHSGTHIDAPSHFQEQGGSCETITLGSMIGPCSVLDLTHCIEKITHQDLERYNIGSGEIILLKTKN